MPQNKSAVLKTYNQTNIEQLSVYTEISDVQIKLPDVDFCGARRWLSTPRNTCNNKLGILKIMC